MTEELLKSKFPFLNCKYRWIFHNHLITVSISIFDQHVKSVTVICNLFTFRETQWDAPTWEEDPDHDSVDRGYGGPKGETQEVCLDTYM